MPDMVIMAGKDNTATSRAKKSGGPDRDLIKASRAFAVESLPRSWWHVFETLGALGICTGLAAAPLPMAARVVASIVAGLIWVRGFILFHDYMHGAILRNCQ